MASLVGIPALAAPLTPAEQARVLAEARKRFQKFAATYRGDFSRRSLVLKELDPKTKKLLHTKHVRQDMFNYLYKPPSARIVSCKVDGKKVDVGECKPRGKRKVFHHVFDKNGHVHYTVKIVGAPTIRGLPCHKVKVIPKKKTDRHFAGHLYLHTKDLRLVLMEGMPAALSFPVKEMWLKIYFKQMPGHPGVGVASDGTMNIRIKVPLFVHMRMRGRFRAWGHRLIRR